jgi:hypothetical protein
MVVVFEGSNTKGVPDETGWQIKRCFGILFNKT